MIKASREALVELDAALRKWGEATDDSARKGRGVVTRLVADVQSEVQARARLVQGLETELASARGDERSRVARALQNASTAYDQSKRALREVQDVERQMHTLQRRVSESTQRRVPAAVSELKRKVSALDRYQTASGSTGTTSAGARMRTAPQEPKVPLWKEVVMTGVTLAGLAQTAYADIPHSAAIQHNPETATSQQAQGDRTSTPPEAIRRLDERRKDEAVHQLGHAYTDDVLRDAKRNAAHPGKGESDS